MIHRVLMQTVVSRDFEGSVAGFRDELGFEAGRSADVGPALAGLLATSAAFHPRYALLAPAGVDRGFLRLVEGPRDDESGSFHRPGLFNAELHSKDVDALHARLSTSRGFRILSEPQTYDLASAGGACSRSFATRGPGGAGVFFTTYISVPPPRQLPKVDQLAGAVFNCAVSTDSRPAVEAFYEGVLGMHRRMQGRMAQPSINRILGLPDDWGFLMFVYKGEGDGLIEVDVHEQPLPPAPHVPEGQLAPGNSVLTLESPDLDAVFARAAAGGVRRVEPRPVSDPPYDGRRAGLLFGPAGERIELVEVGAA